MAPVLALLHRAAAERASPLPPAWAALLAPHLPDLDLAAVRVRAPCALWLPRRYVGLTLADTIYLRVPLHGPAEVPGLAPLLLHELVHVAQFRRYGWWRMCARYGAGLAAYGYHLHPLEIEARAVEARLIRSMA